MVGEKGAASSRALLVGALAGAVVLVAVAVFLLRGNGSDGAQPVVRPTVTTSSGPPVTVPATPSASSLTVTAPVVPEAATKRTAAGAVAFVTFFWETFNYSYSTLDSRPLRVLSESSCKTCLGYAEAIDQARSRGERFRGGTVKVRRAVAAPGDLSKGAVVTVLLSQEAGLTVGGTGEAVSTATAVPAQRLDTALRWDGARWTVLGMDTAR